MVTSLRECIEKKQKSVVSVTRMIKLQLVEVLEASLMPYQRCLDSSDTNKTTPIQTMNIKILL